MGKLYITKGRRSEREKGRKEKVKGYIKRDKKGERRDVTVRDEMRRGNGRKGSYIKGKGDKMTRRMHIMFRLLLISTLAFG